MVILHKSYRSLNAVIRWAFGYTVVSISHGQQSQAIYNPASQLYRIPFSIYGDIL